MNDHAQALYWNDKRGRYRVNCDAEWADIVRHPAGNGTVVCTLCGEIIRNPMYIGAPIQDGRN